MIVVIVILLKRRKTRQPQEEAAQEQQKAVEPYDYIDESRMRKSTELSDNGYLVPVVTPSDALKEQQFEEPYDYIDESGMRRSTLISDNMYLTPIVTPSEEDSGAVVTPGDEYEQLEAFTRGNDNILLLLLLLNKTYRALYSQINVL